MDRLFTLAEARHLMPEVLRRADAATTARADLAEISAALRRGGDSPLGGLELGWYHRLDVGFAGRRPLPGTV